MSMVGNFLPVSLTQAERLKANPEYVVDFLYSDEVQDSEALLDVDKAWHAVHFLLTGTAWEGEPPLASAVLGGEEIGEDAGYGPARLVLAAEVEKINAALCEITTPDFASRYDAQTLNKAEIYPENWGVEDAEYISGAFEEIKAFYSNAAADKSCVLLFLN